ncbi:DUF1257 domain-containing protein [Nostoc sp. FACHB-152]|uniref:DUF1257 domain-containing protein n=1 Tax=Nostoc sp. FACHB-152 TaxID=2692837 RepID=UPI001681E16D|nr:DUF1257 domain-containing protein [Nostoc sp. FACHB-152]MBD2451856.1 DUF1257 domain-containing protein [Nostoc sp. FACHB-152]
MSHFSKIAIKFKDQSCLVEALQRFGFYPQIHDKPVHLYGYRGDQREQTAHIVVPRNQISHASNDLGFYWNGTEFECFISDYDKRYGQAKKGFGLGPQFLPKLQEEYINLYLPKLALQMGGEVVETVTHGSVTTVRVSLPTVTVRR